MNGEEEALIEHAKLTEASVLSIRAERTSGRLIRELAATYGVSKTAIVQALNGKRWGHVR